MSFSFGDKVGKEKHFIKDKIMKVLVTGATGQLGSDMCKRLKEEGIEYRGVKHAELDICNKYDVVDYLTAYVPDAVIHCAAYTAVDKAEDEPDLCYAVNADGTRNIAEACKRIGSKMMYISTDYVFDGTGKEFFEVDDSPAPINIYGKSKLKGEVFIRENMERYFIVRTSWMFGQKGDNFIKRILTLTENRKEISVVTDQIGSPTYTVDLAALLCEMVQTEQYGIYHATNQGVCSRREWAQTLLNMINRHVVVKPIKTLEYQTQAQRPLNSRLSPNSLIEAGFYSLPKWQSAVQRYLEEADFANV